MRFVLSFLQGFQCLNMLFVHATTVPSLQLKQERLLKSERVLSQALLSVGLVLAATVLKRTSHMPPKLAGSKPANELNRAHQVFALLAAAVPVAWQNQPKIPCEAEEASLLHGPGRITPLQCYCMIRRIVSRSSDSCAVKHDAPVPKDGSPRESGCEKHLNSGCGGFGSPCSGLTSCLGQGHLDVKYIACTNWVRV